MSEETEVPEEATQSDLDVLDSAEEPETEEASEETSEADDTEEEPAEKEEEPKEESEEQLPEVVEGRFAPKELKAAYPDIYKKFPDLRRIIAHENEYSKVFATPEEAKGAAELLGSIEELGMTLRQGDPGKLIDEVSQISPKSLEKFAENFLPKLFERDPRLIVKTVVPYFNRTLRNAQEQARQTKDKNLFLAAQYISQYLHGTPDVPDERRDPELEQERENFERQKQTQAQREFQSYKDETYNETYESIMDVINDGLDPNDVMTERQRRAAASDIFDTLDEIIRKDDTFMQQVKSMWKMAQRTGQRREASKKIKSAFLARVKTLLPSVRQKVRADYLPKGAAGKKEVKKYIPSSATNGKGQIKQLDPKKIVGSDMDILNDTFTYKK